MASLPHTPVESTPESSPQLESLSEKLETIQKKNGPRFSESQTDPPHSAVHHSFSPDDIVKPMQPLPVILSPGERQAQKMSEEVPGYFPSEDTLRKNKEERDKAGSSPSIVEKVKNTIVALGDYAKEWSDYAKGYVPASLSGYIGGREENKNGSGSDQDFTDGIGSLPPTPREVDVAHLPEEREHSDEINRHDSHAPQSSVQSPAVRSTSNPFRTQKFLQMQHKTAPLDVCPSIPVNEPSASHVRSTDTALPLSRTQPVGGEPTTVQSQNAPSGSDAGIQPLVRMVSPPEPSARAVPSTAKSPTTECMSDRDPEVTTTVASVTERSGSGASHDPTIPGASSSATAAIGQPRETGPITEAIFREETPATDSAPASPQRDEGKRFWGLSRRRSQGNNKTEKAKELHEPEVETPETESRPKMSFRERLSGFFRRKPKELHRRGNSSSSESSAGSSDYVREESEEPAVQEAPRELNTLGQTGELATSDSPKQMARQRSDTVPSAMSHIAATKDIPAAEHDRPTKSNLEGRAREEESREAKQYRTGRSYSHPAVPKHTPTHFDETMGPLPAHVEMRGKNELPTKESGSGSRVGVGSLPGPRNEAEVAELPDERRADEARVISSQREQQREFRGTPSGQGLPSSRTSFPPGPYRNANHVGRHRMIDAGMPSAPQVALGMCAPTQSQEQIQEVAYRPAESDSRPGQQQDIAGMEHQPTTMSYGQGMASQQGYQPRTEYAGQQAAQSHSQADREPSHPAFFSLDRARKEQEERAREIKTGRRRTIFNAGEPPRQTSEVPYHEKSAPVARSHQTVPVPGIRTTDPSFAPAGAPGAHTHVQTDEVNRDAEVLQREVPQGTGSSSISAPQPTLAPTSLTARLAGQHGLHEVQTPLESSIHPSRSSSAEDASPTRAPPSTREQISGTRVDVIHPLREEYFRSAAEVDDGEPQMGSGAAGVLPGYPSPAELNALIGERMYDDQMRAAGAAEPVKTSNRLTIQPRVVVDQLESGSPSNDIPDIVETTCTSEYTTEITEDIVAESPLAVPAGGGLRAHEDVSRAESGFSTKTEHGSVSEPSSTNITPPTGTSGIFVQESPINTSSSSRSVGRVNESVKPPVGTGLRVDDLGAPVSTGVTDDKERQGYEWEEIRASPHN